MIPEVDLVNRQWPEWDHETQRTEMSSALAGSKLVISAVVQEEVGRLEANIQGDVISINSICVQPKITLKKKGFFQRAKTVSGRRRGYGTMLIRGLQNYARRNNLREIQGGVTAAELEANRYLLEWYSRRGFIVERVPAKHVPKSVASIKMLL
ncbi:hypothetical protein BH09VER1_BH09VER1_22310 [soil metagenome]